MPIIDPFEKHSDAYDDWFNKNSDLYEAELDALRPLVPLHGARGLETGVGTGKFAEPLGIKTGVDPSEKMAAKARKLGIEVYPGVAEALPFPDAVFDFVLMVTTICFVDDIVQAFREAFRVLKPDGFIVVGFVDRKSELGLQYVKNRTKSKFYSAATFFSAQEVLEHLEESGFKPVQIKQTIVSGMPLKTILDGFGQGSFVVIKAEK